MTANITNSKPKRFAWHATLLACLYTCFIFSAFDIYAKEAEKPNFVQSAQIAQSVTLFLNRRESEQGFNCNDTPVCERIIELCEDRDFCFELIRICIDNPALCEEIFFPPECDDEEDCEPAPGCDPDIEECDEFPECDEETQDCESYYECVEEDRDACWVFLECNPDEEDCDAIYECEVEDNCEEFPECEEDMDECEELPECDEGTEECEELPECDEGMDECEELPECDEGDEECEELPECDEGMDECEELPECDEGDEECEELPECDEGDEECEELPECDDENEECESPGDCDPTEETCATATTGYINPNPVPSQTIMQVDTEAANRASRFLARATLGADYPLITLVASLGESAWLETQFQEPVGALFPQVDYLVEAATELEFTGQDPELFGGPLDVHNHAWWTQVMTSPDLVRQRVAMALSEILVVSANVELIGESPFVVTQYYDTLLNHSFGNFRDLLKDISLTPAMAIYLSHLNNQKANPATGTFPDENYAREIMQLFSIGLFELNPDGTRKKDANGNDIPTYGQNEIREFAKIFTGLSMHSVIGNDDITFGFMPCCNDEFYQHARDMLPLKMYDEFHSEGEKRLLNGTVVPAGQTGMQDIDAAIDNLFNHPNVGPFIGKQLIQRLVTSNPSPAYVSRVTAAFNGETGSPRGDMKAVIRAILLDPEAQAAPSEMSGRLREPFLRLVRLARAFNATTPDRNYASIGVEVTERLKQYVWRSPSVFNFFQPTYSPNGEIKDAGLVAPEFQIVNASTIIEIKNFIDLWVDTGRYEGRVGQLAGETVSFEAELALADNSDALLDRLDTLLTYGTLSENSRNAIKTAIDNESDALSRVKKAVYLMAISPDYATAL